MIEVGRAEVIGYHAKTDVWEPPLRRLYLGRRREHDWRDDWDDDPIVKGVHRRSKETVLAVVEFAGERFHRPVPVPAGSAIEARKHLGSGLSPAHPLGAIRPPEADATLRSYLLQPRLEVPIQVVST